MKELVSFEQALGGDGAKLHGKVGVVSTDLTVQVAVAYPVEKIIEPAMKVIDGLVDKLEALIPGDQKSMAASAKADARAAILKALTGEDAQPAAELPSPAPASETPAQA